ncbi:hypothetical protein I6F14_08985 [Bradyrhizobium sp. IC3069]|nr:hypothetical protein [Bradyrhizobium sp. IC4059]MCA1518163.1 hypothetical protein [Bradyrhizobium sp. IC3069]
MARTGTWKAALFLASVFGAAPAAFAAEPNCRSIESTSARLSCYDAAFPPKARKPTEAGIDPSSGYKDSFLAEEARTAAKLKNICRGC